MKKFLFILCAMAIMLCIFTATAGAEAITDSASEVTSDIANEPATTAKEGANPTLFTRIWEYAVRYKSEILGVSGDALIFICVILLRGLFKKKTSDISSNIKSVKGDTSQAGAQQVSVVGAVNELIGGYNSMKESYEKYETAEDDRNRIIGAVMVQNTAILDMLQTVYANSKNLPQGVKDMLTLKYANALKTLDNDEILRTVVDSVHEKVNTGAAAPDTSEDNL